MDALYEGIAAGKSPAEVASGEAIDDCVDE
jgi:hypothetical protein